MDKNIALSDDELLAKCGTNQHISTADMGVEPVDTSGLKALNEGFDVLHYADNSDNHKKNQ